MIAIVVPDPNNEEENIEFALVNPKIISESVQNSYLENGEGCLSVKEEHQGYSYRHARIKVRAYDLLRDESIVISASGFWRSASSTRSIICRGSYIMIEFIRMIRS